MTPSKKTKALESLVDPRTRDFVKSVLDDATNPINQALKEIREEQAKIHNAFAGWTGNVQARINKVEDSIADIPRTKEQVRERLLDLTRNLNSAEDREAVERLADAPVKGEDNGKDKDKKNKEGN